MAKQKERGKYFERRVVDMIRKSLNLKKYECQRAATSGNMEFEFGDIYFNDPIKYPFIFECKFGYNWEFSSFFPTLSKQLLNFLKEAYIARDKYIEKLEVLPKHVSVVLAKPHYRPLCITTQCLSMDRPIIMPTNLFKYGNNDYNIYVYLLENALINIRNEMGVF